MKTKNLIIGTVALMFALSLNYKYATNDYGILENTLLSHAQASSSSSSSSSSSNSTNECSGIPDDNSYCGKKDQPEACTLYLYTNASGEAEWSDKHKSGAFSFTGITKPGIKINCPKKGNGCKTYACREADENTD